MDKTKYTIRDGKTGEIIFSEVQEFEQNSYLPLSWFENLVRCINGGSEVVVTRTPKGETVEQILFKVEGREFDGEKWGNYIDCDK
jgi:hypothetical protein